MLKDEKLTISLKVALSGRESINFIYELCQSFLAFEGKMKILPWCNGCRTRAIKLSYTSVVNI